MDSSATIRKLQKAQGGLGQDILLKLKVGSEEMASALHKYRAMAAVIAEIEKDEDADDERLNKL